MTEPQKPSANFLRAADFEQGVMPSKDFALVVERLEIDGESYENVSLKANYDRHLRLNIFHEMDGIFPKIFSGNIDIRLLGKAFREPVDLLYTLITTKNFRQTRMELTPSIIPVLWETGKEALFAEAVVINGPPLFFKGMKLNFDLGDFDLVLTEFPTVFDMRKTGYEIKNENVATGYVILKRKDCSPIHAVSAYEKISHFCRFLTFVRGGYCGVGNISGFNQANGMEFCYLGFTKADQFNVKKGWCGIELIPKLPDIYARYRRAVVDEDDAFTILRAIEFYRAANIARESSLEMALVASHAALESLVPHVLMERAGWSDALIKNRQIRFHDKMRAAASFIQLDCNFLEHSPQLRKRAMADGNIDAFELVSKFRNRIVHADKGFSVTGHQLVEIFEFSQWLCEIFLFYFLDYRGEMYDRRRYTGFRGPAVRIPLQEPS